MIVNITLAELNRQESVKFMPILVIYIFYVFIGTLGNGTVLFVHPKLKHPEGRRFIPYLAVVNLVSGLIGSCFSIALIMYRVNFYYQSACRIGWYLVAVTQILGSFILLLIASDQYRRICKPHANQMNKRVRIFILLLSLILAAIVAIPLPFQYKVIKKYRSEYNLTTYSCMRSASSDPTGDFVYADALVITGGCSLVAIFVLYGKIGCTLRDFIKRREDSEISTISLESLNKKGTFNTGFGDHSSNTNTKTPSSESKRKTTAKHGNGQRRERDYYHRVLTHFVKIFVMISLSYLLTLILSSVIVLQQSVSVTFWESLTDAEEVALTFFSTFYIAQNIFNPFIFAFMDHEFRVKLKYLLASSTFGNLFRHFGMSYRNF